MIKSNYPGIDKINSKSVLYYRFHKYIYLWLLWKYSFLSLKSPAVIMSMITN